MPRPRSLSPRAARTSPLAPPSVQLTYFVGRGEQGVLSFEPYKSFLLPLWRFKDPAVARPSCDRLEREFNAFVDEGDFVGADMARKFLQGMTRAQRYANHAGGLKYSRTTGAPLPRASSPSSGNPGAADKLASAAIFRAACERAKACTRYAQLRAEWEERKRGWERDNPREVERLRRERDESRARKGTRGGKAVTATASAKRGRAAKVEEDEGEADEGHEEEQVKAGADDEAPTPPARASKRRRVTRASAAADTARDVKQE
ncbi:hypothetical protein JCM3775_002063 [Rhodotorula graminis]|uniref:Uncharacterized protein n=1 Tax=Rhodotorula graminis (strain WP1) TaxID=578459 RepID=A0A0P9EIN2_RHOGW|nr:uncharacterized protein RHOBADRAFT_17000 [Rhodotorula graminis WP1]KPV73254.1 hypothetical protein RHOBADRAFT_17000 [Rhodotorula graminis WP1]